jgi:hypothetical protein
LSKLLTVAGHSDFKESEMAFNRIRLPCPACGNPIVLSRRKVEQYNFQVGCVECKTISQSAELLGALKATDAATRDLTEDCVRSDGREWVE